MLPDHIACGLGFARKDLFSTLDYKKYGMKCLKCHPNSLPHHLVQNYSINLVGRHICLRSTNNRYVIGQVHG